MRHTRIAIVWAATLGALAAPAAGQGEIGYVEDFALAADRTKALEQLVPGSDAYYYYHCLHYQNTGQRGRLCTGPRASRTSRPLAMSAVPTVTGSGTSSSAASPCTPARPS